MMIYFIYHLLYKAEKPSVHPSVYPFDRHAGISAVSAYIETGLAQNESWDFWDLRVYFYKSKCASIHPHKSAKAIGVS